MLVLSRKIGEQIVMPDQEVVVTVVAIQGNRVRIGITAPSGVSVFREEICPVADARPDFADQGGMCSPHATSCAAAARPSASV